MPHNVATDVDANRFEERVVSPDLNVNSGVYAAIDPALRMELTSRGEYEYVGLGASAAAHAREFLQVSAFGRTAPSEDEVADQLFGAAPATVRHPVLGVYQGLYVGYAEEGDYRERGSSGGIATWILAELLRTGRVDGIIHLVPTRNPDVLFEYRISRSLDEVAAGSKSRYYPGQLADVLGEIASRGGRYAVTAIPSFAYEIRLLQRARPEYRKLVPYVIGLICGHQKTANYAAQLAWRSGIAPGDLEYIDFRKKDPSAPASKYLMEMHGRISGEPAVREARQGELLGTDWGHGLFKSNFADFTEDAFNETADIVLGDAWLPRYVDDSAGTNVVIARNPELDHMLRSARDDGRLHLEDCSPEDMLRSQSALVKQSVTELPERFRSIAARGQYVPRARRTPTQPVPFARRQVQRARLVLSRRSHDAWAKAIKANDLNEFDRDLEASLRRYHFWQRMTRLRTAPRRALAKAQRFVARR